METISRRGFVGGLVAAVAAPMVIRTGIVTLPLGDYRERMLAALFKAMKDAEHETVAWATRYAGPLIGADLAANVGLGMLINKHQDAVEAWVRAQAPMKFSPVDDWSACGWPGDFVMDAWRRHHDEQAPAGRQFYGCAADGSMQSIGMEG